MTEPNDEDRETMSEQRWMAPSPPPLRSMVEVVRAKELDALRLALAACEARENALRDELARIAERTLTDDREGPELRAQNEWVHRHAKAMLSAPRDSEALRAFGERVVCAIIGAAGEEPKDYDITAIVARILSGGASE